MRGASSLSMRLERLAKNAGEAAEKAASLAGESALQKALEKVPVRTGRLRSSIRKTKNGNQARVTTACSYASYVEMGTRKMRARPFLAPAFLKACDTASLARLFREALE